MANTAQKPEEIVGMEKPITRRQRQILRLLADYQTDELRIGSSWAMPCPRSGDLLAVRGLVLRGLVETRDGGKLIDVWPQEGIRLTAAGCEVVIELNARRSR